MTLLGPEHHRSTQAAFATDSEPALGVHCSTHKRVTVKHHAVKQHCGTKHAKQFVRDSYHLMNGVDVNPFVSHHEDSRVPTVLWIFLKLFVKQKEAHVCGDRHTLFDVERNSTDSFDHIELRLACLNTVPRSMGT